MNYEVTIVGLFPEVVKPPKIVSATAVLASTDITGVNPNTPATLFVGVGGDIQVITIGGSTLILKNIASGSFLPIQVTRVKATSTTATDIVALF